MVMNAGLADFVSDIVRQARSKEHALANVASISGTQVTVRRLGASISSTPEGPYPTQAGAAGFLKVGDLVSLQNADSSYPIVGFPVEGAERSNLMALVGSDLGPRETDSHTTYEEILRVEGLEIAAHARLAVHFFAEVEPVGGTGVTDKQVQLVFNDTEAITVDLSSGAEVFWMPFSVSAYASAIPTPSRAVLLQSDPAIPPPLVEIETVTSVSVLARTNDTGEGNDIVRASDLLVFS